MTKKNAVDSLKESIRLLEIRQAEEGKNLREQFENTYESFKLVNMVNRSLKSLTGSVELRHNLFGTVLSIVSGYLSKKAWASSKSNPFMKILGSVMQFGITAVVAKNADNILNFLDSLIERFFHSEKQEMPES